MPAAPPREVPRKMAANIALTPLAPRGDPIPCSFFIEAVFASDMLASGSRYPARADGQRDRSRFYLVPWEVERCVAMSLLGLRACGGGVAAARASLVRRHQLR
eukprot:213604-Chlamydomonas_euryale.AAC.6